jgi:hypothetical protein
MITEMFVGVLIKVVITVLNTRILASHTLIASVETHFALDVEMNHIGHVIVK